ncbi:MAG: hypothetical protein KatS3mg010_0566 [Acidimicrobiia bacterium]|nr:MAG: hypothetical protein KatS3mg010_0566 [Acidimicrobiia bacterium]
MAHLVEAPAERVEPDRTHVRVGEEAAVALRSAARSTASSGGETSELLPHVSRRVAQLVELGVTSSLDALGQMSDAELVLRIVKVEECVAQDPQVTFGATFPLAVDPIDDVVLRLHCLRPRSLGSRAPHRTKVTTIGRRTPARVRHAVVGPDVPGGSCTAIGARPSPRAHGGRGE